MQASKQSRRSSMPKKLCYKPMNQPEVLCFPPLQNYQLCSGSSIAIFDGKYCTLESSSRNGEYSVNYWNIPSSLTFSPSWSSISQQCSDNSKKSNNNNTNNNTCGSPISGSCITYEVNDLRYKLRELETAMFGVDPDFLDECYDSNEGSKQIMEAVSKGDLKRVLIACARAVSDDDQSIAQWLINELRKLVSVSGEPIQRLGAYMLEGLVAKISSSGSCIYKALRCKEPASSSDILSYMHILYEVCPYFKFGYMSANGAIAEAMKDENWVHIIDFQIAQGSQWITLIQAFAARPGGPPHIRITGIDDSVSANARGGGLNLIGKRLAQLARSFKVPFEFHAAAMFGCEVEPKDLGVRPGEALAVNFPFMLHHMPDESVTTMNHRDRLLRLVKGLAPKVVTLVEQESNTNTAAFYSRFLETLDYYKAMFESIDATLPREHRERINVEQHCLAREVVNIIACEGGERVERHELLGKWRLRFSMAGFSPYPLSSLVNATIKRLLQNYSDKYRLEEREGALYLGWMNRDLVASCAWKCE